MSTFAVFADGVDVDLLEGLDTGSRRRAASQALNKVARDARALAIRQMRSQIALPKSYFDQKRFFTSPANQQTLEAKLTARGRATMLARFVKGSAKVGKPGVYVEVKPGKARYLKRAFLIKLPQGQNAVTDTLFNLGLAIRLRPGETIENKLVARRIERGLYILYGPSVSQVFRANDGDGVASDIAPDVAERLQREFLRLLGI